MARKRRIYASAEIIMKLFEEGICVGGPVKPMSGKVTLRTAKHRLLFPYYPPDKKLKHR